MLKSETLGQICAQHGFMLLYPKNVNGSTQTYGHHSPVPVNQSHAVEQNMLKTLTTVYHMVTVGRSDEMSYTIPSVVISRCHATITRVDGSSWTITDNSSFNGTSVNGHKLKPSSPHKLQEGDIVQFGVPSSPDIPAEFVYKFYSALKVLIKKNSVKKQKTDETDQGNRCAESISDSSIEDDERNYGQGIKRFQLKSEKTNSPTASKAARQLIEESKIQHASKEAEYLERLAQMESLLKQREDSQNRIQRELEQERKEKENQVKAVEELKLKERAILQEMKEKQEQLEKERDDLKKKMQADLEANIKERETSLLAQLASQRARLLAEKTQVEQSLHEEMMKALDQKNKELEQRLLNQKQKLEKILETKDMERKLLQSQLNDVKEENATAKLQALKAREDVLSNFVELMEVELQCPICNELIIKANSLNCAHVFCNLCISQWMKVKQECPICRAPVTSRMQAIALDNYIDKMVEQLNDDMKLKRADLVIKRKADQQKFDTENAGPSTTAQNTIVQPATGRPGTAHEIGGAEVNIRAAGRGGTARAARRGARGNRGRRAVELAAATEAAAIANVGGALGNARGATAMGGATTTVGGALGNARGTRRGAGAYNTAASAGNFQPIIYRGATAMGGATTTVGGALGNARGTRRGAGAYDTAASAGSFQPIILTDSSSSEDSDWSYDEIYHGMFTDEEDPDDY